VEVAGRGSRTLPRFVGGHDDAVGGCTEPICANKGGLALLIFEYQVDDLLHVSLLDLVTDEFQSSSRISPLFATCRHWISRLESIRLCPANEVS
jgi:hypothetical protein